MGGSGGGGSCNTTNTTSSNSSDASWYIGGSAQQLPEFGFPGKSRKVRRVLELSVFLAI